jgi:hypothetical protein
MEYNVDKKEIKLDRKINQLDKFVIDFTSLLDKYVVVSGYVSILFGRSRATEDIDLLAPLASLEEFTRLWEKIYQNEFECLNTDKPKDAFDMLKEHAIRFARKGKPLPNIEFKTIKNDIEKYSYNNKIKVILESGEFFISPIEMQIAYKLLLGSEKDLEDAKHLYKLFNNEINKQELNHLIDQLKVKDKFKIIQ